MNTTDAPSVLICKDGELFSINRTELDVPLNTFKFYDVVLFLQDGQPVTLGELEVEDDFQASILDRVFDKWYHAYVD
tara:strand:+ start:14 stop:244 length:231 start_codon:yes stop_codon:yes gene_type:complete